MWQAPGLHVTGSTVARALGRRKLWMSKEITAANGSGLRAGALEDKQPMFCAVNEVFT